MKSQILSEQFKSGPKVPAM